MNEPTSKIFTETQECCELKQETLRNSLWVGDNILLVSLFDKCSNSQFLSDERNPALSQCLGRTFQVEDGESSKALRGE